MYDDVEGIVLTEEDKVIQEGWNQLLHAYKPTINAEAVEPGDIEKIILGLEKKEA